MPEIIGVVTNLIITSMQNWNKVLFITETCYKKFWECQMAYFRHALCCQPRQQNAAVYCLVMSRVQTHIQVTGGHFVFVTCIK